MTNKVFQSFYLAIIGHNLHIDYFNSEDENSHHQKKYLMPDSTLPAAGEAGQLCLGRIYIKYYDKNTKFLSDFYLHSCTLHLSLPNDSHHFDITGHTKQISKLHQMHYDPDPGNIKLIYYLSDVLVEDEGPFSYVRGSSSSVPLIKKISGASLCGLVNFNNKTSLKFLKSLPNSLKFFNIIGSLVNDHEINRSRFLTTLLNNEIKFYSDKSDIIFFDPEGFHRGGFCMNKKSRLNIQCIFKRSY